MQIDRGKAYLQSCSKILIFIRWFEIFEIGWLASTLTLRNNNFNLNLMLIDFFKPYFNNLHQTCTERSGILIIFLGKRAKFVVCKWFVSNQLKNVRVHALRTHVLEVFWAHLHNSPFPMLSIFDWIKNWKIFWPHSVLY